MVRNQNTSLGELASKIDVEGTLKTRLNEILDKTGGATDVILSKQRASGSLFVRAFGNIARMFDTSFGKMVAFKRADVLMTFKRQLEPKIVDSEETEVIRLLKETFEAEQGALRALEDDKQHKKAHLMDETSRQIDSMLALSVMDHDESELAFQYTYL